MKNEFNRMVTKNNKLSNMRLDAKVINCLVSQVVKVNNRRFMVHAGIYDNISIFATWTNDFTLYANTLNTLKRKIVKYKLEPFDIV
jgi:hypothetical protein